MGGTLGPAAAEDVLVVAWTGRGSKEDEAVVVDVNGASDWTVHIRLSLVPGTVS